MTSDKDQLNWYAGDLYYQDYLLQEFIIQNKIERICYLGDCNYIKTIINSQNNLNPQLCIFIVNSLFKFSEVVYTCNKNLENLGNGSWLYLSVNKFLAESEPQEGIVEDYDDAIYNFIANRIKFKIVKYYSGKTDQGRKFNWVHPLTRFYFLNENS